MAGGLVPIDQNRPADLTQAVHFGRNRPELSPETPGQVRPDVAFVHVRSGKYNCYQCRIEAA